MHFDRIHKRGEQGLLRMGREQHVLHDLAHGFAGSAAAQLGGGQIRQGNVRGRQNGQRHLGEKAARMVARQAAEIRPRGAIQAHRHDGGAGARGDEGRAVVDFHQTAGGGETPFREHHHRAAGFQQLHHFFHRQRIGGIDGEIVHQGQNDAEPEIVGDPGMHHEHRLHGKEQAQHHAVQEGFVVGDDKQTLGAHLRGIAAHSHAEQQLKQQTQ
jgi:hypothetical protein